MKSDSQIQTEFQVHCLSCPQCRQVNLNHTVTLQLACLVGAPLLRDDLSEIATKSHRKVTKRLKAEFEMPTKTTKQKLKGLTKYVGEAPKFPQLF